MNYYSCTNINNCPKYIRLHKTWNKFMRERNIEVRVACVPFSVPQEQNCVCSSKEVGCLVFKEPRRKKRKKKKMRYETTLSYRALWLAQDIVLRLLTSETTWIHEGMSSGLVMGNKTKQYHHSTMQLEGKRPRMNADKGSHWKWKGWGRTRVSGRHQNLVRKNFKIAFRILEFFLRSSKATREFW